MLVSFPPFSSISMVLIVSSLMLGQCEYWQSTMPCMVQPSSFIKHGDGKRAQNTGWSSCKRQDLSCVRVGKDTPVHTDSFSKHVITHFCILAPTQNT